ncbi:hypothetical protein [Streptomyces sp. NBC_00140]|uniref:hypothetical protein n=1 Tax=Streptomyces sp. NBC_00140 TaxID=2975664 RepID=UPI00338F02E2
MGGNLSAIRTETGAGLPSLQGAILFLEHQRGTGLGEVDRALTQLIRSRALEGLRGVALGQFLGFDRDAGDPTLGGWGIRDVLHDRLTALGVPVLGGLPAGHGNHPLPSPWAPRRPSTQPRELSPSRQPSPRGGETTGSTVRADPLNIRHWDPVVHAGLLTTIRARRRLDQPDRGPRQ